MSKRERFWEAAWFNLFHIIGVVAVIGFVSFFAYGIYMDIMHSEHEITPSGNRDYSSIRATFHRGLIADQKPCARKSGEAADVSGCDLFRLSLYMSPDAVTRVLNGSGYFTGRASLITPKRDHRSLKYPYVHESNDVFSISIDFSKRQGQAYLAAHKIMMVVDVTRVPYLSMNTMWKAYVQHFGKPDRSVGDRLYWGDDAAGSTPRVEIWEHQDRLWVTLERDPFGEAESSSEQEVADGER